MNEEVFRAVAAAYDAGEQAAVVTIVSASGSTPQRVGAKMLVFADGRTVGTIGGGCYENDAVLKAREGLSTRQPRLVRYELADDIAAESGLICGGQMEVFIEPLERAAHLYIVGAGHVSAALARFAAETGFRVHVLDDREKFANRERFPTAAEIVVDTIADALSRTTWPPESYVVVVTRGHRFDLDALRALSGLGPMDGGGPAGNRPTPDLGSRTSSFRYVGMIGSRAKVKRIFDALAADNCPADWLAQVHAPIGLDIGAVTPAEIAVSIVAEIVAARNGKLDSVVALSSRR